MHGSLTAASPSYLIFFGKAEVRPGMNVHARSISRMYANAVHTRTEHICGTDSTPLSPRCKLTFLAFPGKLVILGCLHIDLQNRGNDDELKTVLHRYYNPQRVRESPRIMQVR